MALPKQKLTSRQRREQRQIARLEKLMRSHKPSVRQKVASGCLVIGIAGFVIFVVAVIFSAIRGYFFGG